MTGYDDNNAPSDCISAGEKAGLGKSNSPKGCNPLMRFATKKKEKGL